jgi:hypothetical protein
VQLVSIIVSIIVSDNIDLIKVFAMLLVSKVYM